MVCAAGSTRVLLHSRNSISRKLAASAGHHRPRSAGLLCCQASKTTSSRSSSTSRPSTASSRPDTPPTVQNSRSMQDRLAGLSKWFSSTVDHLTPKQEGDLGDVLMMSLSLAVLVYLSMQLYRLYAYAYFSASHYQALQDIMQ